MDRWENFIISHYHLFIESELNNLGIAIDLPDGFDEFTKEAKNDYFENTYYSNKKLFIENKDKIKPYDVILIDEIQDYKRKWMEIVKECFLSENGEYVLFGDVKQNIYNNKTEGKDVSTNVRGVTELKQCFRSDFKIKDLAILYQKDIFKDKYEIDNFNQKLQTLSLPLERNQQGDINYMFLPNADSVSSLFTIIHENTINKNISPNDITILGNSVSLLKKFDAYYRYASNERTNTMFETPEIVYRMGLNYLKKDIPEWLKKGIELIDRQDDKSELKAFDQLSILFTVNDLYQEYQDKFKEKLEFYCNKFKTSSELFLAFLEDYKTEFKKFKEHLKPEKQPMNLKKIRDNKKLHFYLNSGTVKISTIHSFKGWESETVFLILEDLNFQMTFDEILYTGITRTRANLILINFGNNEYHKKLKGLIEKVK